MIRFTRIGVLAAAAAVALAPVAGCSKSGNPASPSSAVTADSQGKGKPAAAYQLNLSHVECVDDQVEIHFVLLHVPDGVDPPASFDFSYGGGTATADRRDPKTGNVWHYTAYVPSGTTVDVESFSIVVGTQTVWLHNAGAYAGTYECTLEDVCETAPPPAALVCLDSPLGNERNECAFFAPEGYTSTPLGKDEGDDITGVPHEASMDAGFVVVKTGSGSTECNAGQHAYRIIPSVTEGDSIPAPTGGGISHVTYCSCPVPIVQ